MNYVNIAEALRPYTDTEVRVGDVVDAHCGGERKVCVVTSFWNDVALNEDEVEIEYPRLLARKEPLKAQEGMDVEDERGLQHWGIERCAAYEGYHSWCGRWNEGVPKEQIRLGRLFLAGTDGRQEVVA